MGLFGDVVGKVVLKYEADTAQAKIALRELTGEQKKNAQAAVQGMEDQKKAHEQMVKGITLGLGIAAGALALGIGAYKAYANQTRLTAASSGADMDALRKASHGLITDLDLMGLAAQGMNGRFKLSSEEMAKVLGAAVELSHKGFGPLDEIAKKLGDAIRKGEVSALKELGIAYDETLAKTDQRAAAMKALAELSREAANASETEADRVQRTAVELGNMWDHAKAKAGEYVHDTVAGWAIISDKFASHVDNWTGVAKKAEEQLRQAPLLMQALGFGGYVAYTAASQAMLGVGADREASAAAEAARKRAEAEGNVDYLREARLKAQNARAQAQLAASAARAAANRRRGGGGGDNTSVRYDDTIGQRSGAGFGGFVANDIASRAEGGQAYADGLARTLEELRKYEQGTGLDKGGGLAGYGKGKGKGEPSFLEKHLGPMEQFDLYRSGFDTLTGAATAGFEALVTGSESAGKAMKRVIGQSIMAEGSHMLVRALREGAEAIAALATGNFAKAGTHGLAAAKFAAGAAVAGVVAHSLGAGGGAGASASAGGSAGGVTNNGNNTPQNTNIVLGHGWDDETPRQRSARFARASRMANSYEAPPSGVSYS